MSKIYGYSFDDKEGVLTIVDYIRPSKFNTKNIRVPNSEKWIGLETTTQGNILIVANSIQQLNNQTGEKNQWLRMMAIDTSSNTINIIA